MLLLTIVAVALSVLALAVGSAAATSRRHRWIDDVTHQRVLIHTTDDSSFDGVLIAVDPDALVLADAKSLDGPDPVELAGEQWITRDRVKFVQVVSR